MPGDSRVGVENQDAHVCMAMSQLSNTIIPRYLTFLLQCPLCLYVKRDASDMVTEGEQEQIAPGALVEEWYLDHKLK